MITNHSGISGADAVKDIIAIGVDNAMNRHNHVITKEANDN